LHSELCGQNSNFGGRKINQQGWYFNKCQVPYASLSPVLDGQMGSSLVLEGKVMQNE